MIFQGKDVVVTGGANGIGLTVSRKMAAAGGSVWIFDLECENPTEAARSVGCRAHIADVTDPQSLERAFDEAGTPDVVVANAGIGRAVSLADTTADLWNRTLAVNLTGAFHTVQIAAERMKRARGGAIVLIVHEGTVVMIDDGCTVDGYNSDITRTFVLGKATDKMKRIFDIVHRAQSAALAAAKPGIACQEVDAAARRRISDAGYGPDYNYFTHRLGHGIGMDGHEWPYLVRGNTLPLAPNMTFSDEPGIYILGEFGVRLEDDMHITEDGAQLFTPQSPSIEHPFG